MQEEDEIFDVLQELVYREQERQNQERDNGMNLAHAQEKYTNVNVKDLLEKLKANRQSHQQEWEEAHAKWRELQTEQMQEYKAALQAAIDVATGGGKIEFPNRHDFVLEEPISHSKEYDKVIARMEMTVDETLYISHNDFDRYVLDDWSWKREFAATASLYNG